MKKWNLNSWTKYQAKHLPAYQDKKELDMVLGKLKKYPPLVFAGETRSLKKSLAQVVDGKAFLLQGGDCAESFAEFHPDNIRDTLKGNFTNVFSFNLLSFNASCKSWKNCWSIFKTKKFSSRKKR